MTDKTELQLLKERASAMGIKFSPNIGLKTLKGKVDASLSDDNDGDTTPTKDTKTDKPKSEKKKKKKGKAKNKVIPVSQKETKTEHNMRLRREASRLVRVRITCMNQTKKDWEGEIITVSNSVVGTQKKFIKFNTDYHVPIMILTVMKERQYQYFVTKTNKNGVKYRAGELKNEFAIEYLDPLTPAEMDDLAKKQALAGNIEA